MSVCLDGLTVCPYGEQVEEVNGQPEGKGGGGAPVVGDHVGDDLTQPWDACTGQRPMRKLPVFTVTLINMILTNYDF